MHAISWKGRIDLSVCCLKKIDNRHSPLKSHLLPINWKSHYWLSQGVSAHVEEVITYQFSPYNLAACEGQSHPLIFLPGQCFLHQTMLLPKQLLV